MKKGTMSRVLPGAAPAARTVPMADDGPDWGKVATVGFEVAIGIGLGCVVGLYVDRKLGSSPWGLLIGILLGCAGGMYLLIKEALRMNKD